MLLVAFIYSTYIKSRRATAEVPKGASVVSDESATPEDRVLYGREYSSADIEIYLEEDMEEEYVEETQSILAMFPAGVIRDMSKKRLRIILYADDRNRSNDENAISILSENKEKLRENLIYSLCEYTDKVYKISDSEAFVSLTDRDFISVMKEYVEDKYTFRKNEQELCEYLDEIFKGSESIEEILNKH